MTATLTFKLPEEADEHRDAVNGSKWKLAMWDLDQLLRDKLKYEILTEETSKAFEFVRKELFETLEHHELYLD